MPTKLTLLANILKRKCPSRAFSARTRWSTSLASLRAKDSRVIITLLFILKSETIEKYFISDSVRIIKFSKTKVIETRLSAYSPLNLKKPPKYWSNLGESFIKARNATR